MRFRPRGKRDKNHAEIVRALRAAGRSVVELHSVGAGCPDIAVGWARQYMLFLEIKNPDGRNSIEPSQELFAESWRGPPVVVVRSVSEALAATGVATCPPSSPAGSP